MVKRFVQILCVMIPVTGFGEVTLVNPEFELPVIQIPGNTFDDPEEWDSFASKTAGNRIGVSTLLVKEGKQSVRFATQGREKASQGLFQIVKVSPGKTYRFRVFVRNDPDAPLSGSCHGEVSIEWLDAEGVEIDRSKGDRWNKGLSKKNWRKQEVKGHAPHGAVVAKFLIIMHDGFKPGEGGAFFLDSASID